MEPAVPCRKALVDSTPVTQDPSRRQRLPAGPDVVTVTPYPDGPLVLRGPVVVLGEDGEPLPRSRPATALCRCGLSSRAPICDGSHKLVRRDRTERRALPEGGQPAAGQPADGQA